ncbi:MAG: hypothetical protein GX448_09810 [Planctomycetes bacterium]|nr:hypothetical protein [Planctomycetota bacterium]
MIGDTELLIVAIDRHCNGMHGEVEVDRVGFRPYDRNPVERGRDPIASEEHHVAPEDRRVQLYDRIELHNLGRSRLGAPFRVGVARHAQGDRRGKQDGSQYQSNF